MQRFSAIIVDDEPDSIQKLKIELTRSGNVEVLESVTNPQDVIKIISNLKPDIVFLDVNIPKKSGIEILKEIAENEFNCHVIMVTAYSEFMLDAFRNSAFDYLLKPVDHIQLKEVIERIDKSLIKEVEKERVTALIRTLNKKIKIPSTYETYFFDPEQIIYFEADGRYTKIYTTIGQNILTSLNLGAIEKLLPDGHFFRVSKSGIVNLQYLVRIDRKKRCFILNMEDKELQIKYSKLYLKNFQNEL